MCGFEVFKPVGSWLSATHFQELTDLSVPFCAAAAGLGLAGCGQLLQSSLPTSLAVCSRLACSFPSELHYNNLYQYNQKFLFLTSFRSYHGRYDVA